MRGTTSGSRSGTRQRSALRDGHDVNKKRKQRLIVLYWIYANENIQKGNKQNTRHFLFLFFIFGRDENMGKYVARDGYHEGWRLTHLTGKV